MNAKTPEQALIYLCDCQLATVCIMAGRKEKSKFEYERQKSIAQYAVDAVSKFGISVDKKTRCDIVKKRHNGNVEYWLKQYEIN